MNVDGIPNSSEHFSFSANAILTPKIPVHWDKTLRVFFLLYVQIFDFLPLIAVLCPRRPRRLRVFRRRPLCLRGMSTFPRGRRLVVQFEPTGRRTCSNVYDEIPLCGDITMMTSSKSDSCALWTDSATLKRQAARHVTCVLEKSPPSATRCYRPPDLDPDGGALEARTLLCLREISSLAVSETKSPSPQYKRRFYPISWPKAFTHSFFLFSFAYAIKR